MRYPKTFMISHRKPAGQFYRGKLGEPLNVKCAEFNLDPNMRLTYNCLHDPLLRNFFRQPQRKKQLLKQGLISTDDQVLCSLKELNQYDSYIKKVQLGWNKHYHQQQKQLLTGFLLDKMEGKYPQKVDYIRMTNWLISRGRTTFRKLSKKIMKPGGNMHDAELAWEVGHRLQLKELHKEIIRELRLNRSPHHVLLEIRKSGGAIPAPPCTLIATSTAKEPSSRDLSDPLVSKEANGAGDLVVVEEHLQHEPTPAGSIPAALPFKVQPPPVHSTVLPTMDLVNDVLRNIQDSPGSDCSLPEISSYESSELQSYASYESLDYTLMMDLDEESQVSPDTKDTMDFLNAILKRDQDSPISEIAFEIHPKSLSHSRLSSNSPADGSSELQHVPAVNEAMESSDLTVGIPPEWDESTELQGHSSVDGMMESSDVTMSLDQDAKMVSPDTLVTSDLVNSVLRKIQDSPTSETSFDCHPDSPVSFSVSSDSEAQMVSPDSEVTMYLVNGILRKIQDSPSAFSLLETSSEELSELQKLSGMGGMLENSPVAPILEGRFSSPAGYESSDVTLIDLEMAVHSSLTSLNVSPMSSDAQLISPTSEDAFDLVRGVLGKIQDSPSLDLRLTQSSCNKDPELQSFSEKDMGPNTPFAITKARGSSPASYASSDITLIDLELDQYIYSNSATSTSLSMNLDAQRISPKSEAIRDLVSDVLRSIEDSPCSDLKLEDAASDGLQGLEADITQSDATGQPDSPTGTENPNMRKRVHTFFTRSWKSVHQIFTFARRSRKIHPL